MLPERDITYLIDIHTAIGKIQSFTHDVTWTEFLSNELLQHTIIRLLTIIGEAAAKMSESSKQTIQGIEWEDITGMRNRLVHEYFRVNLMVVWETVQYDLPALLEAIKKFIPSDAED